MRGPVEQLLANTPAEQLIGEVSPQLDGEFPWSFAYGARARRRSVRSVLISLAAIVLGSIVAVAFALKGGWNPSRMMALSLVAYLVLTLAVPKLLARKKGGSGWERQVMIDGHQVRVIDRRGDASVQWRQALSNYRDLRHRVVEVGSKARRRAGVVTDVIELRHRHPGRSIYLWGRDRNPADLMSSAPPEDLERLLASLSDALQLPVSHEVRQPDASESTSAAGQTTG